MSVSVSVGVGKQSEVYEKLFFSTYLQIISGLGLPRSSWRLLSYA